MLRTILIAILLIPTASGFVTEIGYDFIEIVATGELSIGGEPLANLSGTTILILNASSHADLSCPSIILAEDLASRFSDDGVVLSINGMNETVVRPAIEPAMSLNRCIGCVHTVVREATPCEHPVCTIAIESEGIQEGKLTYRVRSDEEYTYWIEDPFATIIRSPAQSSTNTAKSYTPPSGTAQRIYIIRAENACGSVSSVIGFIEHLDPICTPLHIESEPIHTASVSYRIDADEPYSYWIEDSAETIMRAPSVSSTDSLKTYTPPSAPGERIFVIRANTSCAVSARAIGFVEPIDEIEQCAPITIESEPTTFGPIEYRIIAEEEYTYSIEDAFGTVVRESSLSASSAQKSYTPKASAEQQGFIIRANTSCASRAIAVVHLAERASGSVCPLPVISAEAIQTERIDYRINADTLYAYAIENATGSIVRNGTSTTNAVKQYTPKPTQREHFYTISAQNDCGKSTLLVGFLSDTQTCPSPDEREVCAERIERIRELEGVLKEGTSPPQHMTSFYTLAKIPAPMYTYRSSARSNATFLACLASPVTREGDALTIVFSDDAFVNTTPVLIALENTSVRDVRIGSIPAFLVNRTAPENEDPDSPEPEGSDERDDEAPQVRPPNAVAPAPPEKQLTANPVRRTIRTILNLIRTNRTVQSASSWIMPVGIGLAGLMILIPGSKRPGTERL